MKTTAAAHASGSANATVMEPVLASPEAVLHGDRDAWLGLFTDRARIEDPVGAAVYDSPRRRAAFWDSFIAPQSRISFVPIRDFVEGSSVVRQVVIETTTSLSAEPLRTPTLIEYRVEDGRLGALRAFWSPAAATRWFLGHGAAGLWALAAHNLRIAKHVGLGALSKFGLALRPTVGPHQARAWVQERIEAGRYDDLGAPVRIEQIECAGDEVAAVVVGEHGAIALLIDTDRGRSVTRIRRLGAIRPR